jgi:carboxypeptidase C (cathepsin A)
MLLPVLLASVSAAVLYSPAQLSQEIMNLPGRPINSTFRMFSGYVAVDAAATRSLFYWFVEAQTAPEKAPIVLWTNGGPGCSGLGGFLSELGPYRPDVNGTSLHVNPYSWNLVANMLFIEQPAGVGFSTAPTDFKDYGDAQSAKDNAAFVSAWFKLFPQYSTAPFFLTSESYGGHYLPTLAAQILKNGNVPNFRGFAVGNPLTYMPYRDYGMYGTYAYHNLVPKPLFDKYLAAGCKEDDSSPTCSDLMADMDTITANLDPYALDFPICLEGLRTGDRKAFLRAVSRARLMAGKKNDLFETYFPNEYEPCAGNWVAGYLNRADVQTAIHVVGTVVWQDCSDNVGNLYNLTDVLAPMMPVYQQLITSGSKLNILVYSGDDDSVCATLGSQQWIWDLGFNVTKDWAQWTVDGQVAGFFVQFQGFSFATVHGAGHMVPQTRPAQALALFKAYLAGTV